MRAYELIEEALSPEALKMQGKISDIQRALPEIQEKEPELASEIIKTLDSMFNAAFRLNGELEEDASRALNSNAAVEFAALVDKACEKGWSNCKQLQDIFKTGLEEVFDSVMKLNQAVYADAEVDTRKKMKQWKKELDDKVMDLVKKAEGMDADTPLTREGMNQTQDSIRNKLTALIQNLEDNDIKPQTLNKFLELAKNGKIINMKKLVSTKSGKIDDHINKLPSDVQELFNDEFKGSIFSFIPGGTTAGNYGPAEVALAIFGNPANKADKGDLEVDGEMFELKGSGYSKVGVKGEPISPYGARLNSKGIGSGTAGWNILNKQIKKHMPSIKDTFKGDPKAGKPKRLKKGEVWNAPDTGYLMNMAPKKVTDKNGKETYKIKRASRFNFNDTGLKNLNKEVLGPLNDPDKTYDILLPTLQAIVDGHKRVKDFNKLVRNMINSDGTIDRDKLWKNYSAIAYESYHQEDEVENILFINSTNRNYFIVRTKEDLLDAIESGDIKVSGGITWNDDQQKATPQYIRL